MKVVCETERLVIRQFELGDAEFIVRLLNEESFIRYIADKNVRTQEDAINYLKHGPMASYDKYGFGLNLVPSKRWQHTHWYVWGIKKRRTSFKETMELYGRQNNLYEYRG